MTVAGLHLIRQIAPNHLLVPRPAEGQNTFGLQLGK